MTHIINQSLATGIVPREMKIAKVIPIHKSSDPRILKNYRPVSLLPAFSKLLERIVYEKLMKFLSAKNTLYRHQYGFRPKHSTTHPIIHLLNYCATSMAKPDPEFTLAVLCDLSKAFDVINHEILLTKMNNYGIRGIAQNWFRSYLSDRQQFVEIDGKISERVPINIGVPQGSILGPLLYLIYVNDIGNSCTGNILSFADYTTLYTSNSNLNKLFENANEQVNDLYQ
jgi:retron-type reverse transcriptase